MLISTPLVRSAKRSIILSLQLCLSVCLFVCRNSKKLPHFRPLIELGDFGSDDTLLFRCSKHWSSIFDLAPNSPKFAPKSGGSMERTI